MLCCFSLSCLQLLQLIKYKQNELVHVSPSVFDLNYFNFEYMHVMLLDRIKIEDTDLCARFFALDILLPIT